MVRSPLFYVGDKYKLMPQLNELFPININNYVEPFFGGGSSQLNVKANSYILNDINYYIIEIHKMLISYSNKKNEFYNKIFSLIKYYNLSASIKGTYIDENLKKQYPKTYYAKINKDGYNKLKKDFNTDKDILKLYLLLIYGFNHMIRFNSKGEFNLPVGNVDFNKNVYNALESYFEIECKRNIKLYNLDFIDFIKNIDISNVDFIYLDPPYYISMSEYNKFWTEKEEKELYDLLDKLNEKGIRFGITNLLCHKGNRNEYFDSFSKKYKIKEISSNYISFNDNSIKKESIELYVYNY